jgi:hypothetical protein
VDYPSLGLSSGGNATWRYVTTTAYSGGDAAQAGAIADNQSTWMEATVSGPGTFSFYWSVSSESGYDYLSLYDNGVLKNQISGSVAWTQVNYSVGGGNHTLRWTYAKDANTIGGTDSAWVDLASFVLAPSPTITQTRTPVPALSCAPMGCSAWIAQGSAGELTGGMRLAEGPDEAGAAWAGNLVDLSQPFDASFDLYLGTQPLGGQGIAFVLQNDPRGPLALGEGGAYLGLATGAPGPSAPRWPSSWTAWTSPATATWPPATWASTRTARPTTTPWRRCWPCPAAPPSATAARTSCASAGTPPPS